MTDILSVTSLSVAYGKIEAVHDVSLAIKSGQIVTVIGPNGAGKTSLLGAIAGLMPARGKVSFDGRDLARLDVEDRVECGICIVPERRELFGTMSVGDNLLLGAYTRRSKKAEVHRTLEEVFEIFPRLAERRKQLAESLSGGEQQMLALGRGLMTRPRLMLLDEPSLGLAPLIVRDIFRIIASLRQSGMSILLVEQNARAALETADYAYVLETGEIRLEGPASALMKDERVNESYLGSSGAEVR